MITVYGVAEERLLAAPDAAEPVWIDLLEPSPSDEATVERLLGVGVPTREEMQEIEASSRLYREADAVFATAPVLTNADTDHPGNTAITFILTPRCAVTVRYATPRAFETFTARATRQRLQATSADAVLAELLETVIDRLADVLERIGADLDAVSNQIFTPPARGRGGHDLQAVLRAIGRLGDTTSKARDSLIGLARAVGYIDQAGAPIVGKEARHRFATMTRDLRSLSEHAAFLAGNINFLLDATLGMISIQQNNIIKIFSVAAVVFLPPTLIASIYGMNFQRMPELGWMLGYPFALGLMVLSAVLPYLFFKRKGWL